MGRMRKAVGNAGYILCASRCDDLEVLGLAASIGDPAVLPKTRLHPIAHA